MSELKLSEYQQDMYDNYVTDVWYAEIGRKTTVAVIRLKNGFEIVGNSACINEEDFVKEIGRHYALVNALNKLDEFIGFHRQQIKHDIKGLSVSVLKQNQTDVDKIAKNIHKNIRKMKEDNDKE